MTAYNEENVPKERHKTSLTKRYALSIPAAFVRRKPARNKLHIHDNLPKLTNYIFMLGLGALANASSIKSSVGLFIYNKSFQI